MQGIKVGRGKDPENQVVVLTQDIKGPSKLIGRGAKTQGYKGMENIRGKRSRTHRIMGQRHRDLRNQVEKIRDTENQVEPGKVNSKQGEEIGELGN